MKALDFIDNYIEENKEIFIDLAKKIWSYAELPYQEKSSSKLLADFLRDQGFEVEEGISGIPTAFIGKFGNKGYKFGFLGEYDALDSLSQKAGVTSKDPLEGQKTGHGCGHNLLGVGSLAACLATKEYLTANNMEGQLYFFGCPGEEDSGAKTYMARDGVFDNIDFVYTWHPGSVNKVGSDRAVAICSGDFTFTGRSAHAGSNPWLGRSALDAVEIMNIGANYLREHIKEKERVHYAYLDSGGISVNVIPDKAVVKYEVRSPNVADLKKLFARVVKCGQGAALMTETQMDYQLTMVYADYIPNKYLGQIADQALKEVGPPKWTEDDFKLAKKYLDSYDKDTINQAEELISKLYGPDQVEEKIEKPLDTKIHDFNPDIINYKGGATDVGNVAYVCPTLELNVATACLGNVGHTWQMTGQSNSPIGFKGMLTAAKALSLAAIRTLENPQIIEKAKEFVVKQNKGNYEEPLPKDLMPPVNN